MNRTLAVLGWPDCLQFFATCTRTLAGAREALDLDLADSAAQARTVYSAVGELWELERGGERCPVGAVTDIGPLIERAGRGLTLEPDEFRSVASGLDGLIQLRGWAESVAAEAPQVWLLAHPIDVDRALAELLRRSFDATGQLSGQEYPELDVLRRRRDALKSAITSTLDTLLRDDSLALQDRYVTERNGRFVIPVKAGFRRGMGIVHGLSQSGETAFVEPTAVVELHNDLTEAEATLYREERRILGQLSATLARARAPLLLSVAASVTLDLLCARLTFGERILGTLPHVGDDGVLNLHDARHPLLVIAALQSGAPVIGNHLRLSPEHPGLILTGPNAGGKTVALKTLGLYALFARAGLPIPAAPSRIDCFDPLIADIGDQQSVSEGLSTFSAHMQALAASIRAARPNALVLIDEITAGTDPTQGAALARAVVVALVEAGARVAVTTHFPEMKALASIDPRFAVAAAQFADGRPTFRMEAGLPGASFAFAIARRMGISEAVLTRAEGFLGQGERQLARELEAVGVERAEVRRHRVEVEASLRSLRAQEAVIAEREAVLRRRVERAVDEARDEARARFRAHEDALRERVAILQAGGAREANEALRQVREAQAALQAQSQDAVGAVVVEAGERAKHTRLGIVDVLEVKGEKARVRLRGMESWVRAGELTPTTRADRRKEATTVLPSGPVEAPAVHVAVAHNTLDLRGYRVEEATNAVEQYLDAQRNRAAVVFLLHGHGTGALKQSLRTWLNSTRWAGRFRPATAEEGGDALTIVRL